MGHILKGISGEEMSDFETADFLADFGPAARKPAPPTVVPEPADLGPDPDGEPMAVAELTEAVGLPKAVAEPLGPDDSLAGRCYWCGRREWWWSIHGVVVCRHCHPPADPSLVTDVELTSAEWRRLPWAERASKTHRGSLASEKAT